MSSTSEARHGDKAQALRNARALLSRGLLDLAAEQAREIILGDARCAEAHRLLGMVMRRLGDPERAKEAEADAIRLSSLTPNIFQATLALADNRLDAAERLLRAHLKEQADDAGALRLLAEIAARMSQFDASERLAKQALLIAPDFTEAKLLLERVKRDRERSTATSKSEFGRPAPSAYAEAADQYAEALQLYRQVVEQFPNSPENWVSYGHILRTVGRQDDAVAAYRRAIQVQSSFGEAWWALADLKVRQLGEEDIRQLASLLNDESITEQDRISLNFALGRALEQAGQFESSFQHYSEGNRRRAQSSKHDRQAVTRHVDDSIALFDETYFRSRGGAGYGAPDPIFILGMPRAGSTLIEQILSSHPDVEGTMELPDAPAIADWLAGGKAAGFEDSDYLQKLKALPPTELTKLGQGYLWGTGLRRQTSKQFFTDKMPNNWLHLGMILTILPNAKIIDARRNPMACGLSLFRQHFAKGQDFSYDLADIGALYVDYVRMMDHFDRVLPSRIIRVFHEDLVAQPERAIRNLLEQLQLPFDERCLSFHENRRAVRTSSSEQVRQPINREGVDQWRAFEPWLGPLKAALGRIADDYPAVPGNWAPPDIRATEAR